MRRIFQKWLLFFVAVGFCVTFLFSFGIQTWMARSHAETLLSLKIEDVKSQLLANLHNLRVIREECREAALSKARTLAFLLASRPEAAQDPVRLREIAAMLVVDQLLVVDGAGLVAGSPAPEHLGEDLAGYAQMLFFLPLLADPALELVQEAAPIGAADAPACQFAAVARQDAPGFVLIGYSPRRMARAAEIASIRSLAPSFRVGSSGRVIICRRGMMVSIEDTQWLGRGIAEYGIPPLMLMAAQNGAFNASPQQQTSLCVYKNVHDFQIVGILPESEIFAARNVMGRQLVVYNLVLFAMIFILVSTLVQNVVISGIYNVNRSLQKITGGDESERVQVDTNEEFRLLSQGINETVAALKNAKIEMARRLDAELFFARAIQRASLPQTFPPFPGRTEFDIYAAMTPAREVGGDFYDFFLVDRDRLGLVVADVSGKGIPAALFMMKAKTLIKNDAELGHGVARVLTNANRELCENNDTGMFVTVFLAVLDLATGAMSYANAGHNPPWLRRAGRGFSELAIEPGFVLGGLEDMVYEEHELLLRPGDMLFLYTDGVSEAVNPRGERYSLERLWACLGEAPERCTSSELIGRMEKDVAMFEDGAEAADDMTMLALKYGGAKTDDDQRPRTEITVPADVRELPVVLDFVKTRLSRCDCAREVLTQLEMAVEEIFVNIANYAYQPGHGPATVRCTIGGYPVQVTIQFLDAGLPYNPLDREDPDVDAPLEERDIGGLGIYLVKNSMDAIDYQYVEGKNILTIKKTLCAGPNPA